MTATTNGITARKIFIVKISLNVPAKVSIMVSTNRTEDAWLRCANDTMKEAIYKRLLFVTLPDEMIVKESARALHDQNLDQLVKEGQQRKLERNAK